MRMMIEHFITFFLLMLFIWIGVAYILQNIQYSSAREFHGAVVTQLENSYFDEEVMDYCERRAEQAGYQLTIRVYGDGDEKDAKITLAFTYVIPLVGIRKDYKIEGYSR